MIASGIYLAIVLILDASGYFSSFLGGLGEALTAFACVVSSILLAIVGGIWLACGRQSYLKRNSRAIELKFRKDTTNES